MAWLNFPEHADVLPADTVAVMAQHRHRRPLSWQSLCTQLGSNDTPTPASLRELLFNEEPIEPPAHLHKMRGVRWLYAYQHDDGPLNGMVAWDRLTFGPEHLWAECIDECGIVGGANFCGYYRRYLVYRLGEKALHLERHRHEEYQAFVGFDMDYTPDGRRRVGERRPDSGWFSSSASRYGPPRLADAELVGYFEW